VRQRSPAQEVLGGYWPSAFRAAAEYPKDIMLTNVSIVWGPLLRYVRGRPRHRRPTGRSGRVSTFRFVGNSIFSLCLITGLLAGSPAGAVLGGQVASVGDLVRRSVVEISGPGCLGVVIGDRYVLTAAHCTAVLSSLVILKSSLYQDCSHALVDDVFYPPDEKSVAYGERW
jgi:hypothetical protein